MQMTAGAKFQEALRKEKPLQILGTPNAYIAMMAKEIGYKVLYLSGAGVANLSFGLPDLGITSLENVLEDARRIISAVDLPLLVDIDTGWGNLLTLERAIEQFGREGAAGVHLEDQLFDKKCGRLEGKKLISPSEMAEKIQAAIRAKKDPDFIIMARTDAFSVEGLDKSIERALLYQEAGADMLFAEAFTSLEDYKKLRKAVKIPILANMTEFGKTPYFTLQEFKSAGVDMVLYPLTISRAMNKSALNAMTELRSKGTQKDMLSIMQTRDELYRFLHYEI